MYRIRGASTVDTPTNKLLIFINSPLNQIIVPVEAIDKIEIVKGPMSVVYGSGAFFGVINIITNDTQKEDTKSIISTSYGSKSSKKIVIRAENRIDKLHFVFNGSVYDEDGLTIEIDDIATNPPQFKDNSTNNNMARNEKFLNFSGGFEEFYCNMNYTNTQINPFVNFPLSHDAPAIITGFNSAIGYKKEFSEIVSLDSKLSFSSYKEEVISDYYDSSNYTHYELFKSNSYEADITTFITPYEKLDLTFGLYGRYSPDISFRIYAPSEGLPNIYAESVDGITDIAGYTQIGFKPHEKLHFIAGLRAEKRRDNDITIVFNSGPEVWLDATKTIDGNSVNFIPRIATIFKLTDTHIFKFLYGEAIKTPSFQLNLTSLYMPNQPQLNSENIKTVELNYLGMVTENFNTNISLFRNDLNNLITRVSGVDKDGNWYQFDNNNGNTITYGVETAFTIKPTDNLLLKLNGMYQKSSDIMKESVEPAYSPNFSGYFQTSYLFPKNISLALTGRYVGEMETYWDIGLVENSEEQIGRIGDKSDDYITLSANVRVEDLFLDGLFANLKVDNLVDTEVRYPTTTEVKWADKGYIEKGRTFMFSVGMEF